LQPDLEYLRQHYASLSDEALRAIDRTELVEAARQCYDQEVAQRKASLQRRSPTPVDHRDDAAGEVEGDKPNWLEEAACVGTFVAYPGNDAGPAAVDAQNVLRAAGIPCHVAGEEIVPEAPAPQAQFEYRVMVPGALNLKAVSVLDKEIYNPKLEADWKAHFEELSDEELRGLNPDVICAGMQDRIERLRKAYDDEIARRAGR
jgi:hypothetical protein